MPLGRFIPDYAREVVRDLGNGFESEISECIQPKTLGSDKSRLSGLILPDMLRFCNEKRLAPGTPLQKKMVILVTHILHKAGYLKECPPWIFYRSTTPVLTMHELVLNMLTPKIPWPTKERFGGEFASFLSLRTVLPLAIREIANTLNLVDEYTAYLRLAVGNIGYKIMHGQPITQEEKSFFHLYCNCEPGSPGEALGDVAERDSAPRKITAVANANPLVTEAFELAKQSSLTGPGLRFYRLLSTQNQEALVYYHGPHAATLPLTAGYSNKFGPWTRLELVQLDARAWPEAEILMGIRDRYADLEFTGRNQTAAEAIEGGKKVENSALASFAIQPPIKSCGPRSANGEEVVCPLQFMDLPQVTFHLKSHEDCASYTWSYYSEWRQRTVMQEAGGTTDMFYLDIALKNASLGSSITGALNVDGWKLAYLDPTIEARQIHSQDEQIRQTVWIVRDSNVLSEETVNMTEHYTRAGTLGFRPTMAEYYQPPRAAYFVPDEAAVTFIASRLGLNREQTFRNALGIAIAHNVAVFRRLTAAEPPFDVKEMIAKLLNARTA